MFLSLYFLSLQPVKDSDPHFHHFLLSQTEKVRISQAGSFCWSVWLGILLLAVTE